MKRKSIVKIASIVAIVIVLATISGYFYASVSEPFQLSEQAIEKSPTVQTELGSVRKVRLSPFGYRIKYSGPYGIASFKCGVIGSKATGVVYVELKREAGLWKIVSASLNGNALDLTSP